MSSSKNTNNIHQVLFFGFVAGVACISYFYFSAIQERYMSVRSFEDCVKAKFTVSVTYPETCSTPGKRFVNTKQAEFLQGLSLQASTTPTESHSNKQTSLRPADITAYIDDQAVAFTNGFALVAGNPSLMRQPVTYGFVGKPFVFKMGTDDKEDYMFVAQASSSPGVIGYYLVASISSHDGYLGTNAIRLAETRLYSVLYEVKDKQIIVITKESKEGKETKRAFTITGENLLEELPL